MEENYDIRIKIPHTLYVIGISSDSVQLMDIIDKIYYPYVFRTGKAVDIQIHVGLHNGRIIVSNGRRSNEVILDKKNGISQICGLIQLLQESILPWNLYHGSALWINGKTIVFLGASGTGKTTLTAYLLKNCRNSICLSEDAVIIDCEHNKVCPYSRPLHLRKEGMKLLETEYGFAAEDVRKVMYGNYERYVLDIDLRENKLFYVDCYIKLIRNNEIGECEVREVKENIADELIQNCYLPQNVKNNIVGSILLAEKTLLFEMMYSNLNLCKENLYGIISKI